MYLQVLGAALEWSNCPARGFAPHLRWSDGNGAGNDAVLQHHAEDQEDEVEQEHGGAQNFVHLPLAGRDGDDDEEKHDEEQHDGTEEAVAADGDRSKTVEERVEEPRHRKSSPRRHRRTKLRRRRSGVQELCSCTLSSF